MQDWDKHSARVWDIANGIEPLGMGLGFTNVGHVQSGTKILGVLGLLLLVVGISIRWVAIYSLGEYFTGTVVIKRDHELIRTGLYKHLRHPAYAGALLAHLGLGLSFSNWISLTLSSVPYFLAAAYRMRVEEQALASTFGAEYTSYCKSAKRLIPGLY
jgi:protein-S-isoprenylcysteine O-methyltransferase Ste14